jgi:hypothetical protein
MRLLEAWEEVLPLACLKVLRGLKLLVYEALSY